MILLLKKGKEMNNKINTNLNYIVSEVILNQTKEFGADDILKSILDKFKNIEELKNINEEKDLLEFIIKKIKDLWEAKMLTYTGFSYYVNN